MGPVRSRSGSEQSEGGVRKKRRKKSPSVKNGSLKRLTSLYVRDYIVHEICGKTTDLHAVESLALKKSDHYS